MRSSKCTHSCWWADLRALAAYDMFLRTSVLVLAFSSASRWNSIVDSVPSICCSCFSSRFFLFNAINAAMNQKYKHGHDIFISTPVADFSEQTKSLPSYGSPLLFFEASFLAVATSPSIFFSKNSLFFVNISSVDRNFWIASWVVGGCSLFLPPKIFHILSFLLLDFLTRTISQSSNDKMKSNLFKNSCSKTTNSQL